MKKDTFFLLTSVLIIVIAILHSLAYIFFWYWTLWWFDILMHFLGGVWVGMSALWFFYLSGYVTKPKTDIKTVFLIALYSIALLGVSWEIFEFAIGAYRDLNHTFDTILDLVMDITGSLVGLFLFLKTKLIIHNEQIINDTK